MQVKEDGEQGGRELLDGGGARMNRGGKGEGKSK